MFYVTLQQQLCGKHDVWHSFQDENYFKKKKTDRFLLKLSTHPESTVAPKIYKILPCNKILHAVLG